MAASPEPTDPVHAGSRAAADEIPRWSRQTLWIVAVVILLTVGALVGIGVVGFLVVQAYSPG